MDKLKRKTCPPHRRCFEPRVRRRKTAAPGNRRPSRTDRSPCLRRIPPSLDRHDIVSNAATVPPPPGHTAHIPSSFFSSFFSSAGASPPAAAAPAPPDGAAAAAPPPDPTFNSMSLTSRPSRACNRSLSVPPVRLPRYPGGAKMGISGNRGLP